MKGKKGFGNIILWIVLVYLGIGIFFAIHSGAGFFGPIGFLAAMLGWPFFIGDPLQ
jgi:hypothetical protein